MSEEGRTHRAGLGGDRLGPSVGLGAKGQLRAEESAPSVVGGGRGAGCSAWRPSLGKSICACPRQGTGAQLGVHTTSHAFPLTPWGRQDPAPGPRTPHTESLSQACSYCGRGPGPWARAGQDELATW